MCSKARARKRLQESIAKRKESEKKWNEYVRIGT